MRSNLSAAFAGASLVAILLAGTAAQAQTAPRPPANQPPASGADKAGPVVVTGTRSDVIAKPDRLSFNVSNDLQAQTGSIADALRNVPGVEVDLEGRVSLRGDPSVEILIDGRPSAMLRGESRADFLQSMPAAQIERVEVITNPSAAFSPEGSGGVLNLVTKRAQPGARWATIRGVFGTEGRAGASISGAISRKALTVSGDLGIRRFPSGANFKRTRVLTEPSGEEIDTRQIADVDNLPVGMNSRLGVEYDLDKSNRLSGELGYRRAGFEQDREELVVSDDPALALERTSTTDTRTAIASGKASWRKKFAGEEHELVTDLEFERLTFDRDIDGAFAGAGGTQFERIGNEAERSDTGFKVDYKRPVGKGAAINLGYEVDLERNDFDFAGARGDSPSTLEPVAGLTNEFAYDELINALYGTYRFTLGKVELQPGLRFEQANLTIDQKTDGIRIKDDYFRVYPTLHLGYALSETQRLKASYSRRINRPSPQLLNPYTFYIDPQNVRRGNPFLRPDVTDSFELGWQKRKGANFLSATAFYRRSKDGVTEIVEDLGDGIFLSTSANLARENRLGVEAIANGKLGKTISYNASLTVARHQIDSGIAEFAGSRSGTTGTVRGSVTWQPTAKDYFQLNGALSGRQLLPQGYRRSGGMLNAGYRRKVSEKLSLVLTGQDLLETVKQVTVIETEDFRDRITVRGAGRTILAGLTLNLGGGGRKRPDQGIEFDPGATSVPQ